MLAQDNYDLRSVIALKLDASGSDYGGFNEEDLSSRESVLTDDSGAYPVVLTDESSLPGDLVLNKAVPNKTVIEPGDDSAGDDSASDDPVSPLTSPGTVAIPGLQDVDATQVVVSGNVVSSEIAIVELTTGELTAGESITGEIASGELATLIGEGYRAYLNGDYASARSVYDRAMHLDPYNRDANLGVAAVASLQGDRQLAENRYRHLLSLNPVDLAAFSSMLHLSLSNNSLEQEMRAHIEQSARDSVLLHAALGNFYGQQGRWRDAHEAYSRTVAGNTARPDDIYNLAVSLDNLGRQQEALQYYLQAIEADGDFSFNRVDVLGRLSVLQADQ